MHCTVQDPQNETTHFSLEENHAVGSVEHIMRIELIMRHFGLSCARPVYFIHKSTEFHDTRTECQRIIPTDYFS